METDNSLFFQWKFWDKAGLQSGISSILSVVDSKETWIQQNFARKLYINFGCCRSIDPVSTSGTIWFSLHQKTKYFYWWFPLLMSLVGLVLPDIFIGPSCQNIFRFVKFSNRFYELSNSWTVLLRKRASFRAVHVNAGFLSRLFWCEFPYDIDCW